jgi:tetratricopeptide (TPR) repeat protein
MGVVYEAVQESLHRRVAVKVLAADFTSSATDRHRFQREAEAAGRLYHTHIVPVFGVGQHGQLHYYVMQYIDGVGLDAVLSELPAILGGGGTAKSVDTAGGTGIPAVPAAEAASMLARNYWQSVARVGMQVAEALAHAHSHGVVHRDIKPSNLLVDNALRVWVTDFGLAKHEAAEAVTLSGGLVGTLRYMAPEQFDGEADARSDIHSLGLTLYELLVLTPAFAETSHGELVRLKTTTEPAPVRTGNSGVPRDLATIVEKACALSPGHRYQTAAELAHDLRLFMDDLPIRARPLAPIERLWRWSRRNPVVASLSGIAAVLLVAVALVSAIGHLRTTEALDEARYQRGRAETNLRDARAAEERASQQRNRAEANLILALEAFEAIMGDISSRGVPTSLAMDAGEEGAVSTLAPLTSADAELLQTLLVFFDRFAGQNMANLDSQTANAYRRAGDIQERLGQYGDARAAYQSALRIHEGIARASPGNAAHILAHAGVHNAMGILERNAGDVRKAKTAHEDALACLDNADEPGPALVLERARSLNLLGAVGLRVGTDSMMGVMRKRSRGWQSQGDAAASGRLRPLRGEPSSEDRTDCYSEALGLLRDLCQTDPMNGEYRRELADCQRNRMLLALKDSDPSEAKRLLQALVASLEELTNDFPDVPQYQYALADALCLQLPGPRGVAPVSEDQARRAVDISARLSSTYPWMSNYRSLLATAHARMGSAQEDAGRLGEAEKSYRAAVEEFKALTRRTDSTEAYEMAYARSLHGLGDTLRARGTLAESQDVLQRAIALIESHGRSRQPAYRGLLGRLEMSLSDTRSEIADGEKGR